MEGVNIYNLDAYCWPESNYYKQKPEAKRAYKKIYGSDPPCTNSVGADMFLNNETI